MNVAKPDESLLGIAAVERDTGVSKDTLRVWERRYGFPAPVRDDNGDRLYPMSQVERLRLIRRLLDMGCRPAKVVGASDDELNAMLANLEPARSEATLPRAHPDLGGFIESIRLHRCMELRAGLQQMLMKQGLQRFVADTLCHLNREVGQAWMRGELDVPEEHLYTEQVQNLLRSAIGTQASGGGGRPRVLLTTFPDELHGLGLLMVEAMLVPEGASCVSLGVQTPMSDICSAAVEGGFDVVALSFSSAFPHRQAMDGLSELRRLLPATVALWAGGGAVQGRRTIEGVQLMSTLDESLQALQAWRAARLT